jgi:hypothetical protein
MTAGSWAGRSLLAIATRPAAGAHRQTLLFLQELRLVSRKAQWQLRATIPIYGFAALTMADGAR